MGRDHNNLKKREYYHRTKVLKTPQKELIDTEERLMREVNNHRYQLYRGGCDPELEKMLEHLRNQPIDTTRRYYLDLALRAQYGSVADLLSNADRIERYLKQ